MYDEISDARGKLISCIRKIVDAQDGLRQSQRDREDLATLLTAENRFLARNIDEVCICTLI